MTTEKEAYDDYYSLSETERGKRRVAVHLDCLLEVKKLELAYMTALSKVLTGEEVDFSQAVKGMEAAFSSNRRSDGEYESPLRRKLERSAFTAGRVPNMGVIFSRDDQHTRKMFLASVGLKPVKYVRKT